MTPAPPGYRWTRPEALLLLLVGYPHESIVHNLSIDHPDRWGDWRAAAATVRTLVRRGHAEWTSEDTFRLTSAGVDKAHQLQDWCADRYDDMRRGYS